jgi:hypothetical protein
MDASGATTPLRRDFGFWPFGRLSEAILWMPCRFVRLWVSASPGAGVAGSTADSCALCGCGTRPFRTGGLADLTLARITDAVAIDQARFAGPTLRAAPTAVDVGFAPVLGGVRAGRCWWGSAGWRRGDTAPAAACASAVASRPVGQVRFALAFFALLTGRARLLLFPGRSVFPGGGPHGGTERATQGCPQGASSGASTTESPSEGIEAVMVHGEPPFAGETNTGWSPA